MNRNHSDQPWSRTSSPGQDLHSELSPWKKVSKTILNHKLDRYRSEHTTTMNTQTGETLIIPYMRGNDFFRIRLLVAAIIAMATWSHNAHAEIANLPSAAVGNPAGRDEGNAENHIKSSEGDHTDAASTNKHGCHPKILFLPSCRIL